MVTQALKMGNNKRSALFFIYYCIAFLIVSWIVEIVQLATVYSSILDIKYKSAAIEQGLLKIDALVTLEQATLYHKWWMEGFYNLADFGATREQLNLMGTGTLTELNTDNNALRDDVSNIGKQFQMVFYEKNVNIYDRLSDGTKFVVTQESGFDSIEILTERGLKLFNLDIPDNVTTPMNTDDARFIMDNCLNDLLISSDDSVAVLVDDLKDKLNSTTRSVIIAYGVYLGLIGIFMIVCINYLLIMRKSAKRFMNFFFRLDPQEAEKTKAFLKYFMTSLDSDMLDIELPDEAPEQHEEEKNRAKNTAKSYRRASLSKQYRHQIMLFMRMGPFFAVLIGVCVAYLLLMTGIINQISTKQEQIQAALENQNQQNLLVAELVELVSYNNSTTVKNEPISQDFLVNLNQIQQVGDLVNQFRNSDQSLDTTQEEIFYGFPCIYFAEQLTDGADAYIFSEAYIACVAVAGGTSSMGLVETNSELYSFASQLYQLYLVTPKTQSDLKKILLAATPTLSALVSLGKALLELLHEATSTIFEQKANQLQKESVIISVAIMVVTLLCAVWVWFRMVKKIIAYEAKDREILQIVPIKLILANRYLKQHLLQDAGGMLDSIKRFL